MKLIFRPINVIKEYEDRVSLSKARRELGLRYVSTQQWVSFCETMMFGSAWSVDQARCPRFSILADLNLQIDTNAKYLEVAGVRKGGV